MECLYEVCSLFCFEYSMFGPIEFYLICDCCLAQEEENVGNVKRQLAKLFEVSLRTIVPDEPEVEPLVVACAGKFGDYQWYIIRRYS